MIGFRLNSPVGSKAIFITQYIMMCLAKIKLPVASVDAGAILFFVQINRQGLQLSMQTIAKRYSIFWIFNRVELICAAVALSSIWALIETSLFSVGTNRKLFAGTMMLMAIALSYTFILTPYMSGLGLNLDFLETTKSIPAEMNQMHSIYWVLEASKLGIAGLLLFLCNGRIAE